MDNSSGASVRMNSSAVLDICERMSAELRDMNEHVQQIYELRGKLGANWQGKASTIFFDEFDKINRELQDGKMKGMYEILVNVVSLIDENRKLSNQLSDKDFEYIKLAQEMLSQNPTITGVEVSQIATPETSTITSDVNANNTIGSVSTSFTANGVNTELNNSVGINNSINSVVTDFDAAGVNTDLNDSVGIDTTIESNNIEFDELPEINQDDIENVTTSTQASDYETAKVDDGSLSDGLSAGFGAGLTGIGKGGV